MVNVKVVNEGFCYSNFTGIAKFKYERKNEMNSGLSSKNTSSCIWPIWYISLVVHTESRRHENSKAYMTYYPNLNKQQNKHNTLTGYISILLGL